MQCFIKTVIKDQGKMPYDSGNSNKTSLIKLLYQQHHINSNNNNNK